MLRRNKCQISGCLCMRSAFSLESSAVQGYGRRKLVKTIFGVCLLCFAVFSLLFCPSSASALDIGYQSFFSGTWLSGSYFSSSGSGSCSRVSGGELLCTPTLTTAGSFAFNGFDIVADRDIHSNTVISLSINISFNDYPSQLSFNGFNTQGNWMILSQSVIWNDYRSVTVYLQVFHQGGADNSISLVGYGRSNVFSGVTTSNSYRIVVSPWSAAGVLDGKWFSDSVNSLVANTAKIQTTNDILASIRDNGITAKVDNSGVINAVNSASQNQVNATNQNTTAINNAANQAHKDSQAQVSASNGTTNAVNKQTEEQKNQYEQDKQEESDRENQGKNDMTEATGIFNFNILNPFAGIFGLFKSPNSCAIIPTLARWVHSDTSTVCTWWSSDVTTVLTPVFGLASMMIVFGFLVSWLGGSGQGRGIDIGWNNTFYSKHSGEKF